MNNSLKHTFIVALSVSLVCAVIISVASVVLKSKQLFNVELDRQKNILQSAGLLQEGISVTEQFAKVEQITFDLETGEFLPNTNANQVNPLEMARLNDASISLKDKGVDDIAKIGRRENKTVVYLVRDDLGGVKNIILPIRGLGLWSTLYGFLALEKDANTISGIGFYQHGETPGLGGNIDSLDWKAGWVGKKLYKNINDKQIALQVIKGKVATDDVNKDYRIDGLAGATLTTKGVDNLISFWFSENGFQQLIHKIKRGDLNGS